MKILEPIIEKSMRTKGYSREEATDRAMKWLAKELCVADLNNLDIAQRWEAEAIVDRAMLPPMKKHRMKMEVPQEVLKFVEARRLGDEYWQELKQCWGEPFYSRFFGEQGKSSAMLSPGQEAQDEITRMDLFIAG